MQHLRRIVRFLVNNNNNIFISCKIALKYDLMYIISYGDFIKTAAILTRSENDKSPEVDFPCFSLTLLKVQKSVHLFLFTKIKTLNSPER